MNYKEAVKRLGPKAITELTKDELGKLVNNLEKFKGKYEESGFEKEILFEVFKKLTSDDFYSKALEYSKIHYRFKGKSDQEIVSAAEEAVFNGIYNGSIFISFMEEIESKKEEEEYINELLKRAKKLNKEIGLSSSFFDFSKAVNITIGENFAITDKGIENIKNSKNMEVLMRDSDFRREILKGFINCELPEGFLDFVYYYYKSYSTYKVRQNVSYYTLLKLYEVIGDYRNQALIPFFNSPDFMYYAKDIMEFFKENTGKDMFFESSARSVAEEVISRGKFSSKYYIDFMNFFKRMKNVPEFDEHLHKIPLVVLYSNYIQVKALNLENPEKVFLNTCKFWTKGVFQCGFAENAYMEARILSFEIPSSIPKEKLESLFKLAYSLTDEQIKEFLKTKYSAKAIKDYYLDHSDTLDLKSKVPEVNEEIQQEYTSLFIPRDAKSFFEKKKKFRSYYEAEYEKNSEKSLDFAIAMYEAGYSFVENYSYASVSELFEYEVEDTIKAIKNGLDPIVLNHLTPNSFEYWSKNPELANKLCKEGEFWRLKISI